MPRKTTGSLKDSSIKKHPNPVRSDACPACGNVMQEVKAELDFPVNGEEIYVPDTPHLRCPTCNEVMLRVDEARELRERAFSIYQNKYGLLTANEIRKIRERLGFTQSRLATLLKLGANTISRWEAGRTVQTAAMDLMLRMVRDVPGVAVYLQNQSSPDSEIVLPPSKRKETDAHIAYAELMIMSLINENGGVCSIRRVRTACILLSSKEDLMRSAPSGMKRIVKKWINQVKNYVPLEIWHVAINDLLDKQVLSRDVVQGELVLKIQPNIPLDDLSSDEWLSFEARSVLKIIEHKNSGFSEQLEQSLPSQEREKLKVA